MRGRYADRSGVYRALERDLRQELLAAATVLYAETIDEFRDAWREIDLAMRRAEPDPVLIQGQLDRLVRCLEQLEAIPGSTTDPDTRAGAVALTRTGTRGSGRRPWSDQIVCASSVNAAATRR